MKKRLLPIMIIVACLLSAGAGVFFALRDTRSAEGGNVIRGGQSASGTRGAATGDMREQFTRMREALADTMALMGTVSGIRRLAQDGAPALTADQARALLGVLQPLREETTLPSEKAREYNTRLQNILTSAQRDSVREMAERRRSQGAGGAAGARPGGGTGGAGRQGGMGMMDPAALKDVNPYSAQNTAGGRFDGRSTMEELIALLEKRVK